jgi:hypothetical protein
MTRRYGTAQLHPGFPHKKIGDGLGSDRMSEFVRVRVVPADGQLIRLVRAVD